MGILLNAVIVVLMAYALPVDMVPILNAVVHLIIFVALQVATNIYYKKQGIWKLVFDKGDVQFGSQNKRLGGRVPNF